ncbi:calcium-binding protein [Aureimonas phyllosphaerae]|uniref:Ca2+-binding RTX toxin-like protein n=1 Tax=Aureimonas phyllosphaerae TaxID=1166078 RepID=A0A7W6BXJ5_9HYPH|nr:calcium-binding protein [Aureimonas phyllosphaerae]MBB3938255.1 Ca2+-binding RTX toxin-like protein [Aureimonas phyllosphaerae]MBB3962262.1 Ca2+-binding RTX toxin-like protein [Aureimonas phyllosphaerae]SFF60334.1 Hemolysin-type calcium-binding repeat-containing protein [Aureimonas phyllosphaerae]
MATQGADLIIGTAGPDRLFGLGGDDDIRGADGDDVLVGGPGQNAFEGGNGNDVIFATEIVRLSASLPKIGDGFNGAYSAYGGSGDDILVGMGFLDGGDGNDIIFREPRGNPYESNAFEGGAGDDIIFLTGSSGSSGVGADLVVINGSGSVDVARGTGYPGDGSLDRVVINGNVTGDIYITGIDNGDIVEFHGVPGINSMADLYGRITYSGSEMIIQLSVDTSVTIGNRFGNEPVFAFNETNVGGLVAGAQARIDAMLGTPAGPSEIFGTEAADYLVGRDGQTDDRITGNGGDDQIFGNQGNDVLFGNMGRDNVYGGRGVDAVYGGKDDDQVFGDLDNDRVYGDLGNDTIRGGQGDDEVRGGRDNDMVMGDRGNDQVWGDLGNDTLSGGAGADTFRFVANSGNDIIIDFNRAEGDRLELGGQTYSASDVNGSAVLTLSGGGTIVLTGISSASLDAGAFA